MKSKRHLGVVFSRLVGMGVVPHHLTDSKSTVLIPLGRIPSHPLAAWNVGAPWFSPVTCDVPSLCVGTVLLLWPLAVNGKFVTFNSYSAQPRETYRTIQDTRSGGVI